MNATQAIDRSVAQNEIVHMPYSVELETDLLAVCDDSADTSESQEYWGHDDGHEWRVHLDF